MTQLDTRRDNENKLGLQWWVMERNEELRVVTGRVGYTTLDTEEEEVGTVVITSPVAYPICLMANYLMFIVSRKDKNA